MLKTCANITLDVERDVKHQVGPALAVVLVIGIMETFIYRSFQLLRLELAGFTIMHFGEITSVKYNSPQAFSVCAANKTKTFSNHALAL